MSMRRDVPGRSAPRWWRGALIASALAGAAGCGDDATRCGPGTIEEAGVCLPGEPPPPPCAPGTILDAPTGTCVIDPAACTDGTILVGDACRDPGTDVVVDVLEAPEPNGFDAGGEASVVPAGVVALPAIGAAARVVKGTITPRPDRTGDGAPEPDHDTYVLDVDGAALLDVSVDGAHGLAGAVIIRAEAPALAGWRRQSMSLVGDTARRQVLLPAAGRYHVTVIDTRTLLVGAAVGGDDATYLMSIARLAVPTATTLTATAGEVRATGTLGEAAPRLYALPLGTGDNDLTLTTDAAALTAGLVLLVDDAVAGVAAEDKVAGTPAALAVSGLAAGASALAIVEAVATTTTSEVPFELAATIAPGGN